MKTLLRNGTVVSAKGERRADVLLEGEQIAAVGESLSAGDAQVVDCAGKLLFPGFIDGHTHFDLEVCGTITADDFASGSRAALRGGTTMVVDFAAPDKGQSLAAGLRRWREKAEGKTACDYGFHMTIDDWNEDISKELAERLGREPKVEELAERMKMTPDQIKEIMKVTMDALSITGEEAKR